MKIFFLIIQIFNFCLTIYSLNKRWSLEFNNANIKLHPGVFTEITIQLKENTKFTSEFLDESIYNLSIINRNNDIILLDKYIIINSTENLFYTTYIGLNCKKYSDNSYNIKFSISPINTIDLTSNEFEVAYRIEKQKVKIKLDVLMEEMPGKSINFFKLNEEIYNTEEIIIEPKLKSLNGLEDKSQEFKFNKIVIKPYFERGLLSNENYTNHGILFDYNFSYISKVDKKLEFNVILEITNQSIDEYYVLEKKEFKIKINKDLPPAIDVKVKDAFKYNTEDQTSTYKSTNSIILRTKIPVAPCILSCQFIPMISLSIQSENIHIFNTIIKNTEKFYITINNLDANTEYYSSCELTNTHFDESERNKINITIGNKDNLDIIRQLLPSKDENRIPQCVTFTLKNKEIDSVSIQQFKILGINICYWNMKKDENFFLKFLPTIYCQANEDIDKKTVTFCVAPLPLYNFGEYLDIIKKKAFDENFDTFINNIKQNSFFKVENKIERIYDIDLTKSEITTVLARKNKEKNLLILTFNVSTTHDQPIECYYNSYLKENWKFSLLNTSIVLEKGKNQQINVSISNPLNKTMYSLNFKCFNALPNFFFRYKTTGYINMFTYYHNETEGNGIDINNSDKEEQIIGKDTSLDCNKKKNMINPKCLREETVSIIEKMTTAIPLFFKNLENQVKLFSNLEGLKNLLIEQMEKKFIPSSSQENNNVKNLFENITEIVKHLTYIDCSIYASGSSNKEEETIKANPYIDCRKNKQKHMEYIINILKKNLNISNCTFLNEIIITSKLGNNFEENLKYILFLINELSNNPESFREGFSNILFDSAICLQENFDYIWKKVENQLNDSQDYVDTIAAIKKDVLYILLQTLTNLAKFFHYDELDGYINATKTKTGLILNETYFKIQNIIIDTSKKLKDFDENLYSFGNSILINIEREEIISNNNEIKIFNISNKNIIIKIYSNYMLKKYNAKHLQILIFDSPIVSIKPSNDSEKLSDTVNTFINIILYDENGKEIPIKYIKKKYRPQILYLKKKYDSLKTCYYYNEDKQELDDEGVIIDENYEYMGQKYIKCTTIHLTAFTAGTYNFNSNIPLWAILLILSILLIVLISIIIIVRIVKKRKAKSRMSQFSDINSEFIQKDSPINQ